jgi:asparagine synthase (glutamine-hydrolysing)
MCGIAGIFYYKEHSSETYEITKKLLSDIAHRGPDDEGTYSNNKFSFGMCRLSIIDLKNGHQPISDKNERYQIVFNGEIYNYQYLKQQLEDEGVAFKTNSDTEVILQGYLIWGNEVLNKLEGMFAIAIYDVQEHELFLARDRLGKKPLYFYQDEDRFLFCSEVRALSKCLALKEIDKQSYWDYLTYRYVPGKETIFKGIIRLDKASYTTVNKKGNRKNKYWFVAKEKKEKKEKREECENVTSKFGELFSEAVKKRLVADVPVGVILSGGIDSCAVLYEASKFKKVDSFHVYFNSENEQYNEYQYANEIAKFVGSDLHVVEMTDAKFIDGLNNMHEWTDEPIADLSSIPFKYLCNKTREHVKVALSGEGADEVLAGYDMEYFYRRYKLYPYLRLLPEPVVNAIDKILLKDDRQDVLSEIRARRFHYINGHPYNVTFQISESEKNKLSNNDIFDHEASERYLEKHYADCKDRAVINRMLYVLNQDWLEQNILMKSDKVSMSSSLEVRSPFLDHLLHDYLFSLSMQKKIGRNKQGYYGKRLLKDYLAKKIPDKFIFRKKLGFPVPAYMLFNKTYKDFVYDILSSQHNYYEKFFNKRKVIQLVDDVVNKNGSEESNHKHFIWSLVMFELWHKNALAR